MITYRCYADVAEWQTQQTQNLPVATSYGFESHHRHTASLTVSGQGSFFIVRPDFRISTACAADHRQKSLHTEFITVYRLFLSFYKSLYNCSYFLAELSHEKSAAMPRSTILFHSRLWL